MTDYNAGLGNMASWFTVKNNQNNIYGAPKNVNFAGTPAVEAVNRNNQFKISIPENGSYTKGDDGITDIATGSKQGVGLAYINPAEKQFWVG